MEPSMIESAVGNFLDATYSPENVARGRLQPYDFKLRHPSGETYLIEVKSRLPPGDFLGRFSQRIRPLMRKKTNVMIVCGDRPTPDEVEAAQRISKHHGLNLRVISIEDLPRVLGLRETIDWSDAATLDRLQVRAITQGIRSYDVEHIGLMPTTTTKKLTQQRSDQQVLARQFPFSAIARLQKARDPIESGLKLGHRVEQATVVLSDMKNFSSLVSSSRPEELKESMGKYYSLVRESVFRHGGMLDKFIGDATLAVFGYPFAADSTAVSALHFTAELIAIGRNVLGLWQEELNSLIETGTRVGLATGDLWPINIGKDELEVSLLGDTINLAARLEKNSGVDSYLLDNRTYSKAKRADAAFVQGLKLKQRTIDPGDAKGQSLPIKAWHPDG